MNQVPNLTTQARLVCIRVLLDSDSEDDQLSKESDCMVRHLQTDLYTAITQDILKLLIERLPHKVDNRLLLALCPPHIRSIYLRKCGSITSMGMERLLMKCLRLEKVDLSGVNQLMRPTFFQLCGCVGPQITSINLEGNPSVTDDCVRTLLMNMPNLLQIGLSLCDSITDEAFLIYEEPQGGKADEFKVTELDMKSNLPRLTSVDIQGCRSLSSTSIRHITRLCGRSLKHINMSCTKIDCTALWFLSGYSLSHAVKLAVTIEDQIEADDRVSFSLVETSLYNPISPDYVTGTDQLEENKPTSVDELASDISKRDAPVPELVPRVVCGWEDPSFLDDVEDSVHSLCFRDHGSSSEQESPLLPDSEMPSGACCLLPQADASLKTVPSDIVVEDADLEDICIEDMMCVPEGNPFSIQSAHSDNLFLLPSKGDELQNPPIGDHLFSCGEFNDKCKKDHPSPEQHGNLPGEYLESRSEMSCNNKPSSAKFVESAKSEVVEPSRNMSPIYTPDLESIEMSFIQFHGEKLGKACLEALFLTNRNIKDFATSWTRLDDDMLDFIANHAPDLTSLTLTDCDLLTTVGVANIAQKCRNLRKLHLQGVSFIGDAAIFPVVSHVQSLNLAETNVTDGLLTRISEVADDHLKDLDLSWCEELTDTGLEAIAASCSQLRSLSIRQSCASENTVRIMAETCTQLEEVNLSSLPAFSNDVLCLMAKNFHHLSKVDISWNMDITDAGICALLKNCVYLKDAQLAGLKQLSAKPFLPIINDFDRWRRTQALLRLKLQERQVLAEIQEENYSSDEEFEELFLPHRSIAYAPNLSMVDLTYCDSVNDGHLAEIVAVCRGTLAIRDYYGSLVQPSFVRCQKGKLFLAPIT